MVHAELVQITDYLNLQSKKVSFKGFVLNPEVAQVFGADTSFM